MKYIFKPGRGYTRKEIFAAVGIEDPIVCGFDFVAAYGELGDGFIHVHHVRPLSDIGEEYEVDPIKDLRPVCPNCHAMIHRVLRAMSIERLKSIINASRSMPVVSNVSKRTGD
jgi:predicted HNH restriction endonuclease